MKRWYYIMQAYKVTDYDVLDAYNEVWNTNMTESNFLVDTHTRQFNHTQSWVYEFGGRALIVQSYNTLVAFADPSYKYLIYVSKYSSSTSKQLTQIGREYGLKVISFEQYKKLEK